MRLALLLATCLSFAAAAHAQSPAERALLVRWDDSITHLTSPAAIDQFPARASGASAGLNDLRVALLQLRRAATSTDRSPRELALIRLDVLGHAHSNWPWPEYAMARVFYAMSDSGAEFKLSAGGREGEQYIDAGMRHLAEALRLDPSMPEARQMALAILVPEGDRELRAPERSMVRSLLATPHPEPDVFLVAARDFRTGHKYDSALVMFDRSLAADGDPSRLQLERSRTLQALGDLGGATTAYWRGIEQLTPIGREMYRHDLAWILAPDSLSQFDRLPADSVDPWLRDFWIRRDAAAANAFGERLQEHLRRWNYAFDHFRVDRPWRLNEFKRVEFMFEGRDACVNDDAQLYDLLNKEQPVHAGDLRHREPLIDNRGLVYLHHGPPVRVVYNPGTDSEPRGFALTNPPAARAVAMYDTAPGRPEPSPSGWCIDTVATAYGPNESWLYWFGGSWRVMNFRGSCALGLLQPTTLTSYLPVEGKPAWAARADLTPEYADAAAQLLQYQGFSALSCLDHVQPMIHVSRADADVATRTDSHTPFVPHPWNAVIQAFGLGAGGDQTGEALITYAIPIDSLRHTDRADGTKTYVVAARIVGYDLKGGRTFAVDTVREFTAPKQGTGPRGHLSGWFEFAVDAGDWQIAVRMWQPRDSIGAYNLMSPVRIDGAAPMMLSDLVTGASNGVSWPAPDGSDFPLAVLGAWTPATALELYFEVRGLAPGTEYQSAITVSDAAENAKELLRIVGTDRTTGPTTTVRKSLDLTQLKPGTYRLTVTVTHGKDAAVRTRNLLIVKP